MNKKDTVAVGVTAAVTLISSGGTSGGRLYHNDGSSAVYLGTANVTAAGASKGIPLAPGAQFIDPTSDATYAICGAGLASSVIVLATEF